MRICFAGTTAFGGTLYPDDAPMVDILHSHGFQIDYIPWDDPSYSWDAHDAYINRCTWRYQDKYAAFESWLKRMDSTGKPMFNPAKLQLWNTNKTYLCELAAKGVDTVPSLFSKRADLSDILSELESAGWDNLVCKPSIGAGGFGVERLSLKSLPAKLDDHAAVLNFHPAQNLVVQPYIEEVAKHGEWSFVFFDGEFSHALLKTPAEGEFRVQQRLGGSTRKASPSPAQVEQASRALSLSLDEPPLYARLDGFFVDGRFLLAEFEVCEPYLWLHESEQASAMFAAALMRRLGKE